MSRGPYTQLSSTPPPAVQFERQFEDFQIGADFVEQAMQSQAAMSTPEDDVNMLVQQVGALCGCLGCRLGFLHSPDHASRWRQHAGAAGGPREQQFGRTCAAGGQQELQFREDVGDPCTDGA